MSEFIEALSPSFDKDINMAISKVALLVAEIDKAGVAMKNISTPSGSDSAIKKLTADYDKNALAISKVQIQLERLAQTQNRTKISNNALEKSNLSLEASIERKNKALDREKAKLEASQSLYNKTQAQLNLVNKAYNDLATKKARYNNLTENEEKRLITLQKTTEKYNNTLKAVDFNIGKYGRNVANYANTGFNPLQNSINQLTRELPNAGQSFQIFVMSIGNNIGALQDAVSGIIAQNKILKAEGKATTSVFSQIGTTLLSFNTALYLGIAVFLAYSKEIGEFTEGLFKSKNAIDSVKESQKQLNEANVEGQKNAVEETLKLKSLLAIAKDTSLTYKERMIAVKELQSTYPAYFGNLKEEQILAGNTAIAERELTEAILSRAKANASITKITENQGKIIDIEMQRIEARKQLAIVNQSILKTEKDLQNSSNVTNSQGIALSQMYDKQKKLIAEINSLSGDKAELDKVNQALTSFALEKQKEAILLDYQEEKSTKDGTNAKREDIEAIKLEIQTQDGLLKKLKELRDGFSELRSENSNNNAEFKEYTELVEYYQSLIDSIEKGNTLEGGAQKRVAEFEKLNASMADTTQTTKELTDGMKDFLLQFQEGVFSDAGLPMLFKALNNEIEGFGENFAVTFDAVTQIAQEGFNFLSELSNQHFENQRNNLEQDYQIAKAFTEDGSDAREEVERQYEARQRAIRRREFQAKKQMALFNIAIDTAQGIVAALAIPNVPLSVAIGVIGAIQAGVVLAQQAPQFWTGTDNAPEGWAWTQEKGREIITDKNGNIKSKGSDKGAQLTYLNKGDKVLNNEKTMDYLMFNNDLNNILANNTIGQPIVEVRNDVNFDKVGKEIVKAINDKPVHGQTISDGEIVNYLETKSQRIEIMNKRVNFIPKNV